jgi:hypothetical protein
MAEELTRAILTGSDGDRGQEEKQENAVDRGTGWHEALY